MNTLWKYIPEHDDVDTGPWIFGSKVLVPAGLIESADYQDEVVHLAATKERVKNSPPFDPDLHNERGEDDWVPYEDDYGGCATDLLRSRGSATTPPSGVGRCCLTAEAGTSG